MTDKGLPIVVARWSSKGWNPVGWTYGDSDNVFVTARRVQGWAIIETSSQWLVWNGAIYQPQDKTAP